MNEAADQVPRHLNFISRMQLLGKSNGYMPNQGEFLGDIAHACEEQAICHMTAVSAVY